jgi:hypothetical protein
MRRNEDLRRSGKLNLQEMRPEIQIQRLQKRTDREMRPEITERATPMWGIPRVDLRGSEE